MIHEWLVIDMDFLILQSNALVCALLSLRIMFFQKSGKYRFFVSVVAWLLISAGWWNALCVWFGVYIQVYPSELLINTCACVAAWLARGNIARIAPRDNIDEQTTI